MYIWDDFLCSEFSKLIHVFDFLRSSVKIICSHQEFQTQLWRYIHIYNTAGDILVFLIVVEILDDFL